MKFAIRDIMLVTVIVALVAGWWLDHLRLGKEIEELTEPEVSFGLTPKGTPIPTIVFRKIGDGRKP
jgi:hypothetical protein